MTEEIQRAQAREMYASLLDVSSPERAGAALMIDVVYGTGTAGEWAAAWKDAQPRPDPALVQTCPRRMQEGSPVAPAGSPYAAREGLDTWRAQGGIIGQEKIGLGCSWCGSLHPDRFMELVREGWVVGPTDKTYKCYLGRNRTEEEIAERKAEWLSAANGIYATIVRLGEEARKSPDVIEAEAEEQWQARELPFVQVSSQKAKFYFQHLSDAQKREFVDLLNAKAVKIGYPGHFYTRPFFVSYEPREADKS